MVQRRVKLAIAAVVVIGLLVAFGGNLLPAIISTGGTYTIINTSTAPPKNGQDYQVPILQDMSQALAYTVCEVAPLPESAIDPGSNPSGKFYIAAMNFYLKKGGLEVPGTQFGVAVKIPGQEPTFAFVSDVGLGLEYRSIQMPIPSPVMYVAAGVGYIQFCIGASAQGIYISNAANWPNAYVSGTIALDQMAMGAFANGGATAPPPPPPPPPGALNAVLKYSVAADRLTMVYTVTVSDGTGAGYACKVGPFGDDSMETQLSCSGQHVYQSGGSYIVTFQATDSGSGIFKSSQSVTIPGAPITTSPPTVVLTCDVRQLTALCDAVVSNGTAPYQFSYGTSGGQQIEALLLSTNDYRVTYSYTNPGVYLFTMSVTDASARKAPDQSVNIVAMYPLTVTFNYTTKDLAVVMTPSISGGIAPYVYAWDFGDGSTGAEVSANHVYSANGSYDIALTVTDSAGNSATSAAQAVKVAAASTTNGDGNTTTNPGPGTKPAAIGPAGLTAIQIVAVLVGAFGMVLIVVAGVYRRRLLVVIGFILVLIGLLLFAGVIPLGAIVGGQ